MTVKMSTRQCPFPWLSVLHLPSSTWNCNLGTLYRIQVDWLIAGTNAALGKKEDGNATDEKDSLEATPDRREPPPARDDAPESAEATRVAPDGDGDGDGRDVELVDPIGSGGLEVTPDKRELSPRRDDAPETVGATRPAAEAEDEGVTTLFGHEGRDGMQKAAEEGDGAGAGESADSQRAGAPFPSPEASLTASPSPETRANSSSPVVSSDAESVVGDDGAQDSGSEAGAVSLSSGTPAVDAVLVGSAGGARGGGEEDGSSAKPAIGTVVEIRGGKEGVSVDSAAGENVERVEEGTGAENDGERKLVEDVEEGVMEGSETLTERAATASSEEPAVVGGAPVDVTVVEEATGMVAREEGQQDEEEDEPPAVDAVVESRVSGSDRPTGNGDAGSPLDPKEERAEPEGAAAGHESGDGALSPTGASDLDDSTACLKPELEADASPEAGESRVPEALSAGGLPPPAVVPDVSQEAALPQFVQEAVSSGDDLQSVTFGDSSGSENNLPGSREEAVVVVGNGAGVDQEAEVATFEDVEL